jgi:hypothetical protein
MCQTNQMLHVVGCGLPQGVSRCARRIANMKDHVAYRLVIEDLRIAFTGVGENFQAPLADDACAGDRVGGELFTDAMDGTAALRK